MFDGVDDFSLPEWIEQGINLNDGLDLLGLRNPVNVVGNSFLNGITTISPMIRYLSLRSWFIYMYHRCNLPNNYRDFLDFSVRLESTSSIAMLLDQSNLTGVIGATEASKIVQSEITQITPERLVQQPALNIYANPSIELDICFSRSSGITGLTKEYGLPLAEQIMKSVYDHPVVQRVLQSQKIEKYSREELTSLGELLNLNNIRSEERDLLIKALLLPTETPQLPVITRHRVGTYSLLLFIAQKKKRLPKEKDFFKTVQEDITQIPKVLQKVVEGWNAYLIRDAIAVAHESILEQVVYQLSQSRDRFLLRSEIIENILGYRNHINDSLEMFQLLNTGEEYPDLYFTDIYHRLVNQIEQKEYKGQYLDLWPAGQIGEEQLIETIRRNPISSVALLPIIWIMSHLHFQHQNRDSLKELGLQYQGGLARIGISGVIRPTIKRWMKNNPSLAEMSGELIGRTIDQHLRISWGRMTGNNQDVSVLVADDNQFKYRKNFSAGRTASRLVQAIGWLKQLSLIDQDGITPDGQQVLENTQSLLVNHWEDK